MLSEIEILLYVTLSIAAVALAVLVWPVARPPSRFAERLAAGRSVGRAP